MKLLFLSLLLFSAQTFAAADSPAPPPLPNLFTSNAPAKLRPPGVWTAWENIGGGNFKHDPAVCFHGNRIEFFATATDNNLYHRAWTGTAWTAWTMIGDLYDTSPAVSCGTATRVDVVAGYHGWLYRRSSEGGVWGLWYGTGQNNTTGAAIVAHDEVQFQMFFGGAGGNLIQNNFWGGFSPDWINLGGTLTADPAATSTGEGKYVVLARGTDNAIYQLNWDGITGAWAGSLGGSSASAPEVISLANGTMEAFIKGMDGQLYQNSFDGANWSGWVAQGFPIGSGVSAAKYGTGMITAVRFADNNIYYRIWQ